MKDLWAAAISLLITTVSIGAVTPSVAGDEVTTPATPTGKQDIAVDCTKEVWPHFSPSCLRNVDQATRVRMVTASRR
jgi:hypothetical protein